MMASSEHASRPVPRRFGFEVLVSVCGFLWVLCAPALPDFTGLDRSGSPSGSPFDSPSGSLFGSLFGSGTAEAAPVVKVRSRTKIVMNPVRRVAGGIEVSGRVVDVFSGEPVPVVRVRINMGGFTNTVTTDPGGNFTTQFRLGDGKYDISVAYGGDEYYTDADLDLGNVDVSKQSLTLTVTAGEVVYSKNNLEVTIRAATESGGVSVPIEVYAGQSERDLDHIDRVTTDKDGDAIYILPREMLGEPGRKHVEIRFLGDIAFNPAKANAELLLTTETFITFASDSQTIAYEGSMKGSGRVMDNEGRGVAEQPVVLVVGSRRVGQTLTDDEGRYVVRAPGRAIGAGRFNVQAVFEPSKPWFRKSRSELVKVEVGEPQPVPVTYTLAAFGATALAMIAFLGLRSKPWEKWLARLKKRAPKEDSTQDAEGEEPREVAHGLQLARPSLVSSLRRAHEIDFTGVVRDATRARPLAGAYIKLTHPDVELHEDHTDTRGRFAFNGLAPGDWRVLVRAHGYVSERFSITIPHKGELRGAHVDLLAVRERIFNMYREVAQPILPARDLWGVWTPRQVFDHVRSEQPASALSTLTDFVEEAYFSQRTPVESILEQADELLAAARAEQMERLRDSRGQ